MKNTLDLNNLREIAKSDGSINQLSLTEQSIVKFLREKNLEALSYISETEDAETSLSIFRDIFKKEKFTGNYNIIKEDISLDGHELDLEIILNGKIAMDFPKNQTDFLTQYGVEEIAIELVAVAGTFMVVASAATNEFKESWEKSVSLIKSLSLNTKKATQDYSKVAAMVALGFSMTACGKDVTKVNNGGSPAQPVSPIVDQPVTEEKVMTMLFANHAPVGSTSERPSPFVSSKDIKLVIPQEITTTSFDKDRTHPNLLLTMDNLAIAEYKWNGSQYVLGSVASSDKISVESTSVGLAYALKVSDQSVLRVRYIPAGQTLSMTTKYWE